MISVFILSLMVLSAFFGGISEPLACGCFLLLNGLAVVWVKPAGRFSYLVFLAIPAFFFGLLSSSQKFLQAPFGITATQFHVSMESLTLLLAGWAWFTWVSTQPQGSQKRLWLFRTYGWFVAVVGIVALIAKIQGWALPFTTPKAYGIFPNPNHMSNWLAIAGILLAGTVYADIRRRQFLPAGFSFLAIAAVLTCLAANSSRGGLGIFFLGLIAWAIGQAVVGPDRRVGIFLLAGAALAATTLLYQGAKPLERMKPSTSPAAIPTHAGEEEEAEAKIPAATWDFRLRLQRDSIDLLTAHPLLGVGPGNFQSLFPRYRSRSAEVQSIAGHPESDWLWFASEYGLPSFFALLTAVVLLFRQAEPGRNKDGWITRSAGAAAVLAFLIHGLMDVPGHRPGTVWPVLAIAALVFTRKRLAEQAGPPPLWQNLFLRGTGLVLTLIGLLWTFGVLTRGSWPASVAAERAKAEVNQAWRADEVEIALAAAEKGVAAAPYDQLLRYLYGKALLFFNDAEAETRREFAIQLWLEPHLLVLPLDQATVWAELRPEDTADLMHTYREAMKRSQFRLADNRGPEHVVEHMLRMSPRVPDLAPQVLPFVEGRPALVSIYFSRLPREQFQPALTGLLAGNPDLQGWPRDSIAALLLAWARQGEPGSLLPALEKNPAWWEAGWPILAQLRAKEGKTREALELVQKYLPPPTLPDDPCPPNQAESRWYRSPRDYGAAYVLAETRRKKGDLVGARVVLEKITERPEAPAYFWWLRSRVETEEGRDAAAWESLRKYLQRAVPQFPNV
jgi:O-antigen ligase